MNIQEKIEREERNDVEAVLSTENGRRFVWRVLSFCGVYQDIHTDSIEETGRKLGMRATGLWLMQIIGDANQDMLFQMMKEASIRDHEIQMLYDREELGMDDIEEHKIKSVNDLI